MNARNNNLLNLIRNFSSLVISIGVAALVIRKSPEGLGGVVYILIFGPVMIIAVIFGIIFFTRTVNCIFNFFRTEEQIEIINQSKLSKLGKYMFRGTLLILVIFTIYYYYSILQ